MTTFNNLTARASVTVVAIPLAVYILYVGSTVNLIFVTLLSILAADEFLRNQGLASRIDRLFSHALLSGIMISAMQYNFMIIFILMLTGYFWSSNLQLLKRSQNYSATHNLSLAVLIYPGSALASVLLLREWPKVAGLDYSWGFTILILVLVSIWVCDSLAYFFGSAYGRTKLFPSVSPNKSWEGAVAGFLGSLTLMLVAWKLELLETLTLPDYLVLALITGIFGQLGDLVESKYKREIGIKDSGSLLPGHGGMWDRLDSISMAVPMTWVWIWLRFTYL